MNKLIGIYPQSLWSPIWIVFCSLSMKWYWEMYFHNFPLLNNGDAFLLKPFIPMTYVIMCGLACAFYMTNSIFDNNIVTSDFCLILCNCSNIWNHVLRYCSQFGRVRLVFPNAQLEIPSRDVYPSCLLNTSKFSRSTKLSQ